MVGPGLALVRRRGLGIVAGLWLGLLPVLAAAIEARLVPPDEVHLADGRVVALEGVVLMEEAVMAVRLKRIHGRDRYGRLRAELRVPGRRGDLRTVLVREGRALVDPTALSDEEAGRLLVLEYRARRRQRGLWQRPPVEDARRVRAEPFRFALVAGRVARVGRSGRYVYLDFGRDFRRDFSLRLDPRVVRHFRKNGVEPELLVGHRVEARGWIIARGGPMIEITSPLQLEVAP